MSDLQDSKGWIRYLLIILNFLTLLLQAESSFLLCLYLFRRKFYGNERCWEFQMDSPVRNKHYLPNLSIYYFGTPNIFIFYLLSYTITYSIARICKLAS